MTSTQGSPTTQDPGEENGGPHAPLAGPVPKGRASHMVHPGPDTSPVRARGVNARELDADVEGLRDDPWELEEDDLVSQASNH